MKDNALLLKKAVLSHPEAAMELPIGTAHRWFAEGKLPKALNWLMSHPEVLRSLADVCGEHTDLSVSTQQAA